MLESTTDFRGHTHHRKRTPTVVGSAISGSDDRQVEVPVSVGHGSGRRIPVAQVAVIATMESAQALAAALLPPGSTQRDAFAEWIWGSLVTIQPLGQRQTFGLDGERLQGEVVYSASGNVLEVGLEAESADTRARARERYRAGFEGRGLPDAPADRGQLHPGSAIAGGDANVQGDGAGVYSGGGREEADRGECRGAGWEIAAAGEWCGLSFE